MLLTRPVRRTDGDAIHMEIVFGYNRMHWYKIKHLNIECAPQLTE